MNHLSPFAALKEVRGVVLCDEAGNLTEAHGEPPEVVSATQIANLVRQLNECGKLLGLGALKKVLLKGEKSTCLAASRNGAIITIILDPKTSITEIEKRIENTAWDLGKPSSESSAAETSTDQPSSPFAHPESARRGEAEPPGRPFLVTNPAAPTRRPSRGGIAPVPLQGMDVYPKSVPPSWRRPIPDSAPRWCEDSSLKQRGSAT